MQKFENFSEFKTFCSQLDAIFFDLDGTLVDLHVDWKSIKNHFNTYYEEKFKAKLPSNRFYQNFQHITSHHGENELVYFISYLQNEELKTINEEKFTPRWLLLQGISKLKEYCGKNCIFSIISSNYHATVDNVIQKLNFSMEFEDIIGRDDVKNSKPDPEGFIKLMKKHDLKAEKILYIGDLKTDEIASKKAGVNFLFEGKIVNLLQDSE